MSRLDWFTIAVVGICLAAILFLLSRAMNWGSVTGGDGDKTELVEDLENAGLLDDDTIDPDNMDATPTDGSGDAAGTDGTDADTAADGSDADASGTDSNDDLGDDSADSEGDSGFEDDVPVNTSPSRSSGDYLVIAGSFSLMHNAENFANKLKQKGYPNAYVAKFNSGKFASVIVDSYDSSAEASAMVKELKGAGIEAFSKRKK